MFHAFKGCLFYSLCQNTAKCIFSYGLYTHSYASGEFGGSISRDEYISQVAQDIQNKLPVLFDMDIIRKKFGMEISPTSVVLLQELERFNKLVVRMQRSLAELQRVRNSGSTPQDTGKTNRDILHLFWFSCVS